MIKPILILIAFLILASSCVSKKKSSQSKTFDEVCIQAIDSTSFEHGIIYYASREGESIALITKKLRNKRCIETIKVGSCYTVSLTLLSTTQGFTEVSFRLGKNDLYINGERVLTAYTPVYESKNFSGLCYLPTTE